VKFGLALILSGAIGNLVDRIIYGKVVDFLDFMIGDFHWYIFNVADSAVTIGMTLFIYHSVILHKDDSKNNVLV
jgi:signal peptidase II